MPADLPASSFEICAKKCVFFDVHSLILALIFGVASHNAEVDPHALTLIPCSDKLIIGAIIVVERIPNQAFRVFRIPSNTQCFAGVVVIGGFHRMLRPNNGEFSGELL